ncbi:hypothetical protein BH24PSE2_BH24PSE2_12910 [soil metagenome]
MVVSDKYRYVFVELPRTGSTAIGRELRRRYDGRNILYKHATYEEFLKAASPEQKRYFVFGGLRNPLDDAVSLYFKLATDHQQKFSALRNASSFTRLTYQFRARQFAFAQSDEGGFSRFFVRFYRYPYDNWSSLSHESFDSIVRFETLAEDFAHVLSCLGIEQSRPLPVGNKTGGRKLPYWKYYDGSAIARAKWVFGVYMKKWGYRFPAEWELDDYEPGAVNRLMHKGLNLFRNTYWRYIRPLVYARLVNERRRRQDADLVGGA